MVRSFAGSRSGRPYIAIERVTRPTAAERVLQRYLGRVPPENEDAEANVRWGQKSRFTFLDPDAANNPTHTVIWPPDDELPPEEEIPILDFNEVQRTVEVIRVENPDDAAQYVMVERILNIIFQTPANEYWRFNLNHDGPTITVES